MGHPSPLCPVHDTDEVLIACPCNDWEEPEPACAVNRLLDLFDIEHLGWGASIKDRCEAIAANTARASDERTELLAILETFGDQVGRRPMKDGPCLGGREHNFDRVLLLDNRLACTVCDEIEPSPGPTPS